MRFSLTIIKLAVFQIIFCGTIFSHGNDLKKSGTCFIKSGAGPPDTQERNVFTSWLIKPQPARPDLVGTGAVCLEKYPSGLFKPCITATNKLICPTGTIANEQRGTCLGEPTIPHGEMEGISFGVSGNR